MPCTSAPIRVVRGLKCIVYALLAGEELSLN
jgi:hypothetical protein